MIEPLKTVPISFKVNGRPVSLEVGAGETALHAIRERLQLTGAKEGCGIGECGACTILVNAKAVNACLMLAAQMDGTSIRTVEGLAGGGSIHPLQKAFLDHHAVQCGFCTPGLLMSAAALLKEHPCPDRRTIADGLSGNLCRCTGYRQIFQAVEAVAQGEKEKTQ
ncbi:MAG: (2Fe-2S)-binding protein [Deltaproteobacteria bacterium]|nr:(2Fe-2S)-binding protein [Deltaproteobacteria bacterium]